MIMTLEDVIHGYKEREMEHNKKQEQESYTKSVINHMHQNKRDDLERQYEKLSPTKHSTIKPFSEKNINHKW